MQKCVAHGHREQFGKGGGGLGDGDQRGGKWGTSVLVPTKTEKECGEMMLWKFWS